MLPTKSMIIAARRAEFDFYQKGRKLGAERFIGTPDAVIKVMLEAALKLVPAVGPPVASSDQTSPPAPALSARIVTTKPKPRR
jgi:hypothetical protein